MTRQTFVKRVMLRLSRQGTNFRYPELNDIFSAFIDTIKEVVAEGDRLHINGFGKFYSKDMSARTVRGGCIPNKVFRVPARKKLGFSSFASTDNYIQKGRVNRNMDGLYADILGE
jgi:nucleoid DNA-binding protein